MPASSGPACVRCGDPLPSELDAQPRGGQCRTCWLVAPPFERAVSYGVYEDRIREAIHALKYSRMHSAAKRLGGMLAQAMVKLQGEAPSEMIVVPIPLHRSRSKRRGFNQSRALAGHAIAALRKSHPAWKLTLQEDALRRVRATETQAGLTTRQRRINMRAAFEVRNKKLVHGHDVLLVDDIFTTGATARAAAGALKRSGANTIWVATLARAGHAFPAPPQNRSISEQPPGTLDTPAHVSMHSPSSVEFI